MRLCVLAFLSAGLGLGQPAPTDYIPAGANIALGINLRRLIDSAKLPDLIAASRSPPLALLAQNGLAGLDPLKDIDSITIASWGEGANPPTIAILRGRFANWHPSAPKDAKSRMERIDDQTLIAGDAAAVQSALERHGTAAPPGKLTARIAALDARYDFWGVGTVPKGLSAGAGPGNGFDAIDRFEFGATYRDGLKLEGEAHVRTAQDAKKLTDALRMFEGALKKQTSAASGTKFDLHIEGGTLKLAIAIPESELKKAIAAKVDTKGKIVTNAAGDTVSVTLPGGR